MIIALSNSFTADLSVDTEYDLQASYGAVYVKGATGQSGSVDITVAPPIATGNSTGAPNFGSAGSLDLTDTWQRVQCASSPFPVRYLKITGTNKRVEVVFYQKMMMGKHT